MRLSKRGTVPDEATALASLRRQDASLQSSRRALASLQSSITESIERKMSNRESTMFESVFNRQSAGFWLNRDRPRYNEVVDTALAERAACPHNYV